MKKKFIWIFLIVLLTIPAAWSLFRTGFFITDDAEWMVIRLSAFHQTLVSGQFPVRFAYRLNYGYGYPIFNFAYPGGFYLGEVFHLIGFPFTNSVKIIFGLSLVLAGVSSFFWLRNRFSPYASFLGSLFYVYSPYFLWDIYKRGSMGEVLALSLIPLILWTVERKKQLKSGLLYGFLVVSHNVLALIFSPLIVLYPFMTKNSRRTAWRYVFGFLIVGLSASAFFWLPALYESKLTVLNQVKVSNPLDHFVKNYSLLGWLNLAVFSFAFWFFRKRKEKVLGFLLLAFIIAVFLATRISAFVWSALPGSFLIQYPFRFLSLTLPVAAFLASSVFDEVFQKRKILWLIIFSPVVICASLSYAKPAGFAQKEEAFYYTNEHSTAIHNEYSPKWMKTDPTERPEEKLEIIEGDIEIKDFEDKGKRIFFKAEVKETGRLRVNTLYYPGWRVLAADREVPISFENDKGVIEISLDSGTQEMLVEFRETPVRRLADIISLVSLFSLGAVSLKKWRSKK